MKIHILDT